MVIVAHGKPRKVLTKKRIRSVYGVNVDIVTPPSGGRMNIIFSGMDTINHFKRKRR